MTEKEWSLFIRCIFLHMLFSIFPFFLFSQLLFFWNMFFNYLQYLQNFPFLCKGHTIDGSIFNFLLRIDETVFFFNIFPKRIFVQCFSL